MFMWSRMRMLRYGCWVLTGEGVENDTTPLVLQPRNINTGMNQRFEIWKSGMFSLNVMFRGSVRFWYIFNIVQTSMRACERCVVVASSSISHDQYSILLFHVLLMILPNTKLIGILFYFQLLLTPSKYCADRDMTKRTNNGCPWGEGRGRNAAKSGRSKLLKWTRVN